PQRPRMARRQRLRRHRDRRLWARARRYRAAPFRGLLTGPARSPEVRLRVELPAGRLPNWVSGFSLIELGILALQEAGHAPDPVAVDRMRGSFSIVDPAELKRRATREANKKGGRRA